MLKWQVCWLCVRKENKFWRVSSRRAYWRDGFKSSYRPGRAEKHKETDYTQSEQSIHMFLGLPLLLVNNFFFILHWAHNLKHQRLESRPPTNKRRHIPLNYHIRQHEITTTQKASQIIQSPIHRVPERSDSWYCSQQLNMETRDVFLVSNLDSVKITKVLVKRFVN